VRLSVIVPALDEAEVIEATLRDLRASGVAELIVVDGGSRDDTPARARNLADQVLTGPRGRAAQMNHGAAHAGGDTLWFVHADTRVPAQAQACLAEALGDPGVLWGRFDLRLSGSAWPLRIIERMINLRSRLSGIATGDQGIFVRREVFEAAGGYPPIALMEDVALSRALRRRARPACLRPPLLTSSRRWEQRGILRTVLLMWRLRLAYALGVSPERLARQYR
jgi:rSAM/selenodomain-associated transferase 2